MFISKLPKYTGLTALRSARGFTSSPLVKTTAGYGDPQDEKADNKTPTPIPSSSSDPHPKGHGKGVGTSGGTTDPEVKTKTGNAGGDGKNRSSQTPSESEIKETKKVGEKPKKEEVGGAGPIGG